MQETLSEKTYRELRRKVLAGEIQAGGQLVNRTLAEELNVSLAPIREAIHRLATEGLVEHVPGAGAFVRKCSPQDLEELYTLREAVESCAAAEAARQITVGQLEALTDIQSEFQSLLSKIRKQKSRQATTAILDHWLDWEERFHSIIVTAARNRLLSKVIEDHKALGSVFGMQRHRAAILTLPIAEATCREHAAITAALRDRQEEDARRLMKDHIRNGRRTVLEYLRKSDQSEGNI